MRGMVPILVQYVGYSPQIYPGYYGRLRLTEGASIELSKIGIGDEGNYECSVVFLDAATDTCEMNNIRVYLHVNECE